MIVQNLDKIVGVQMSKGGYLAGIVLNACCLCTRTAATAAKYTAMLMPFSCPLNRFSTWKMFGDLDR